MRTIYLDINESEKKRILTMHSRNNELLTEQQSKEDFPPCVRQFGEPVNTKPYDSFRYLTKIKNPFLPDDYYVIRGGTSTYNWTNYAFLSNFTVIQISTHEVFSYYCKGSEPALARKVEPTKGGKILDKDATERTRGSIIKMGSVGPIVKKIQHFLSKNNYGDSKVLGGNPDCVNNINSCDGRYGKGTHAAVYKFQEKSGLQKDGIVGDETWQQMFDSINFVLKQ
jgi:hypothetical protein